MKRLDKFNIKQLRELLSKENSFIFLEHATRHLAIAPSGLANIKTAVKEEVDSSIDKYDPKLKGLVLGFENIQIIPVSDHGNIFYDDCLIHIDIEGDFYVFRPHIGCSLTGTVNKKSLNHLGLLVHSWFNVAVPNTDSTGYWIGNKVQIGQEVTITVTLLNFSGNLPYICGKLQNNSDSVKTHKKKKFQDEDSFVEGSSLLDDDTGALHNEESFECNDSVNVGDSVNEDFHVKNIKEKKKRRAVNVTLNIEVLPSIDNSINEKSYSGVCETESSFQEKIKHNKGKSKRKRDDSFEMLSSPLSSNKKVKLETFSPRASPITSKSVSATRRFIHVDRENSFTDSDTDMYPLTQKPKETKSEEKTLEIPSHSSDSDSDDQTLLNENETNPSKGYTDVTVLSDVKPQFTSTPFEKLTPTKSKSLRKKGNLDQNTCLDSPNKKSHDFLTSANRRSLSLKSKRICDNQSIPNVKNPTKSMANSSSESEDISAMLSKQITKIDNKQMLSPKKSSVFQNSDSGLGSDDKKSSPNKILRMSSKAKQTSSIKRKVNDSSDSETNDNAQSSSKGGGSDNKKSSPSKIASVSSKTKLVKQAINVKRTEEDSSSDSETNDNAQSSSKVGGSGNKKSSPSKIASVSSKTKLVKQAINVKRNKDSSSDSDTNDNAQSSSKGGGSDNKKSSPSKIASVSSKTKLVKQAINVKRNKDSSSDSDTNDNAQSSSKGGGSDNKKSSPSKIANVSSKTKLVKQAINVKRKEDSSSDSDTNDNAQSSSKGGGSDNKKSSPSKIASVSSKTKLVKQAINVKRKEDSSSDSDTNDNAQSSSKGGGSDNKKSSPSKIASVSSKTKLVKQAINVKGKEEDSSSDSETNDNVHSSSKSGVSGNKKSSPSKIASVSSKTKLVKQAINVKGKEEDSSSDSETNDNVHSSSKSGVSGNKKSSPSKIASVSSNSKLVKQAINVKRKEDSSSDSDTNDNAQSSSKVGGSDNKKSSPSKIASVSSKTKLVKQAINVKGKEDSSSDSETNDNVHSSSKSGVSGNKKSSPSKIASVSSNSKLVKQAINVKGKEEDSSSDSEINDNVQSSSIDLGPGAKRFSNKVDHVPFKAVSGKQALSVKSKVDNSSSDSDTNDSRESRSIVLGLAGKESYSSKISHMISKLDNQASNFKSKENDSSSDSDKNANAKLRNTISGSNSKMSSPNKIAQVFSKTSSVKQTSNVMRKGDDSSSSDSETNDTAQLAKKVGLGQGAKKSPNKIDHVSSKTVSLKQASNVKNKVDDSSSDSETNMNGESRNNSTNSDSEPSSSNKISQVSSNTGSVKHTSNVRSDVDDSSSDAETNDNRESRSIGLGSNSTKSLSKIPGMISKSKSFKQAPNSMSKVSDSSSDSETNSNGKSRKNDFGSDGKQSSLNIFAQVSSKTSSSNPSSDVKSKSDDSSSDSETNTNEKPTNNSLGSDRSPNKIAQTKSIKHALNIKAKVSDSHSESDNNAYSHNTVSSSPATYEIKKTSSKTTKKLKKNNLKSSSDNKTKSRSKNIGNEDDKDFATDSDSNTKSLNEILQEIMNKTLPSYDINSGSEEKLAENDPKLDCSDSHTNKKSPSKGKAQLKNKFPEKSHSATTDVHMSDSVENKLSSSNVHDDKDSTETVQSAITPLKKQKSSRKTKKSNEVSSNLIEKANEESHFQAKSKKTNVSKQDSIVAKSSDQLMEMVNKLLGSSEQTSEIEENPGVKSKKTTSKDVKKLDKNGENMDENKNKKKKKEKKKKEKKKKKDKDDKKKKNKDSIFSIQQQILNSLLKQSE